MNQPEPSSLNVPERAIRQAYLIDEDDPSMLVRAEFRQGRRPGDNWIRLVRPSQQMFRRLDAGLLEATAATGIPRTPLERVTTDIKRLLIGAPLATARMEHERLTKFKALAVLSSDVISSVAYATEAILITLVAAGSQNLGLTLFICLAIVALLAIVTISYRQTIPAYPNGGGSYIVAHENLGMLPGLTAAASLMIDYVLTVSVSIAAGVQALATLSPSLTPYVVPIDVALVVLITMVNLRGVRESATIFALPTYLFVVSAFLLILIGCIKVFLFDRHSLLGNFPTVAAAEPLSLFLILRSFSAGCAAITGTEAISNGIPAFKRPEARNAAMTLTWMAIIISTLFLGTTILALAYGTLAVPSGNPTVIGQIARHVFTGPLFFMFPVFQIATLFILTLAANTSYSDFPRLASLLARDHFLPHQFAFRGDRLAFSTGIISLAILASILLIISRGDTIYLINLYAVGVFLSFTLSQAGMVRHWWRLRTEQRSWLRSLLINGLGATATGVVAIVIASTKFFDGAWIVVLLIPLLILLFLAIHKHYIHVEQERTTAVPMRPTDVRHHQIVPIAHLDHATQYRVLYARSLAPQVVAVHISFNAQETTALQSAWELWQECLREEERVPLTIIEPALHSLVPTLMQYITRREREHPQETLTVVLPEIAERSALLRLFAHPKTFRLKAALFFCPNVLITNVSRVQREGATSVPGYELQHRFLVPVAELDRTTLQSLAYARSISPHVIAVHVAIDPQEVVILREKWEHLQKHLTQEEETHLVIIESPYRSLARPLLAYIETRRELHPEERITVILPEFVVAHWWEYLLHNQTALQLKTAILNLPSIVVTDIPQHLQRRSTRASEGNGARHVSH